MAKDEATIKQELKELFVDELGLEDLEPEDINEDDPIFGEDGLGLDSLDAVEIVVMLQRAYGVELRDQEQLPQIFASINTIAKYIHENT
ncbi:MAG: phosphopantetheine-binding protein [Thermodesulfobacteriota bacterium]